MRGAGCPRVTQPFATIHTSEEVLLVRLACVRRAASVHPEPGSNSPFKLCQDADSHILDQSKNGEPYLMTPAINADQLLDPLGLLCYSHWFIRKRG